MSVLGPPTGEGQSALSAAAVLVALFTRERSQKTCLTACHVPQRLSEIWPECRVGGLGEIDGAVPITWMMLGANGSHDR
jgi:hypothetical protein